ncbi:hypothetical protein [Helicobacter didelphidarum]|nr:hypothetical protein [Helicobacter didelphidarum]
MRQNDKHANMQDSKKQNKKEYVTQEKQKHSFNDISQNDSMRISNDEKEGLMNFTHNEEGLAKFHLIMAFCVLFLILSVFIPKIYLSNNIYYTSRAISKLTIEKDLLYEENMRLQQEIEKINDKHLLLEIGEQ